MQTMSSMTDGIVVAAPRNGATDGPPREATRRDRVCGRAEATSKPSEAAPCAPPDRPTDRPTDRRTYRHPHVTPNEATQRRPQRNPVQLPWHGKIRSSARLDMAFSTVVGHNEMRKPTPSADADTHVPELLASISRGILAAPGRPVEQPKTPGSRLGTPALGSTVSGPGSADSWWCNATSAGDRRNAHRRPLPPSAGQHGDPATG